MAETSFLPAIPLAYYSRCRRCPSYRHFINWSCYWSVPSQLPPLPLHSLPILCSCSPFPRGAPVRAPRETQNSSRHLRQALEGAGRRRPSRGHLPSAGMDAPHCWVAWRKERTPREGRHPPAEVHWGQPQEWPIPVPVGALPCFTWQDTRGIPRL